MDSRTNFPYGALILRFLRGLIPKDTENPGGTSKPSAKGKGSVSGGWITTRIPSEEATGDLGSCNPGSSLIWEFIGELYLYMYSSIYI